MSDYDPRLIAPTCLYLASKVEESTVQARLLVFYIKKMCGMSYNHVYCHIYMEKLQQTTFSLSPSLQSAGSDDKYRFEIKDILEMEMKLLEALDYYLVVFHPYRPLLQ